MTTAVVYWKKIIPVRRNVSECPKSKLLIFFIPQTEVDTAAETLFLTEEDTLARDLRVKTRSGGK